jgi:hypothetical protein
MGGRKSARGEKEARSQEPAAKGLERRSQEPELERGYQTTTPPFPPAENATPHYYLGT